MSRIANIENEPVSRRRAEAILAKAHGSLHLVEDVRESLVAVADSELLDFGERPTSPLDEDRPPDTPQLPRIATSRIPAILPAKSSSHPCPACAAQYVGFPLPPSSILKPDRRLGLPEGVYLASPCLILLLLARKFSWAATLVCALELCGTYDLAIDFRPSPGSGESKMRSDAMPATTPKAIESFLRAVPSHVPGLPECAIAGRLVVAGSASPMESRLFAMLAGSVRRGGYGIEGIELNSEIALSLEERRLLGSKTMRIDLLHKATGVGIEYDSRRWHEIDADADRIRRDKKRIDIARYHGIDPLPLTWDVARSVQAFDTFAQKLRKLIGLRNRKLSARTMQARLRLHQELFARRAA